MREHAEMPTSQSALTVWSATHVGKIRTINEDSYHIAGEGDMGALLYIIADGMGGHNAGEVASQMACDRAVEAFKQREQLPLEERAYQSVAEANLALYDAMTHKAELSGMGTTMTLAAVERDSAVIAQVGDSRAYVIDGDGIRQVTVDHSLVQELIKTGRITIKEAATHPYRHVITRALGTTPLVDIDIFRIPVKAGTMLLLCSDGLTVHVGDADILRIAKEEQARPGGDPAKSLVEEAVNRGGSDNATVILIRVDGPAKGGRLP